MEVKDSGNTTLATFTYDYQGKRTSLTTSTGTVFFHYDGDQVVYETDSNNNILVEYSWDAEGSPVSMTKNGNTYYYHLNGHGDVVALTDQNGQVVAEYEYDAWGNILSQSGSLAADNPYRYAGYRYDEVTGLYYLKSRYYDANDGRFLNRDKFHGFEDDPKSLNQYAYGHGNPVRYVDPEGNWVWLVFNAAMATYDGYQAYKKAKAEGKRGYKLALAVAWAVAGNYIKVGKVYKYLRIAKGTGKVTKGGLNFTKTTAKHMDNPDRRVPVQILQQAIKGKGYKDPRGSNARMYYTIMYRNKKKYNLKVLYDKKTNTIFHFEYARKAMGPLKAIPK